MQNTMRTAFSVAALAVAAFWFSLTAAADPASVGVSRRRFGSLRREDMVVTEVTGVEGVLGTGDVVSIVGRYCETNVVPRLDFADSGISAVSGRLDRVEHWRDTDVATSFADLYSRQAAESSRIDLLESWRSSAAPAIYALELWKTAYESWQAGADARISELEASIGGGSSPGSVGARLDSLTARQDTNDTKITELQSSVSGLSSALAGKQDSIGDLATIRAGAGLGATAVQPWRKVNGHPLSEDVTVSATDVGLEHVVNTGDSDTPVEGGTTKFTTGGAYTELAKKANISDMYISDVAGDSTKKAVHLTPGTTFGVVVEHQNISGKADKVVPTADGNLAALSMTGDLVDSTMSVGDFATSNQGARADAALSRAEAIAGFTLWEISASSTLPYDVVPGMVDGEQDAWALFPASSTNRGSSACVSEYQLGSATTTNLFWDSEFTRFGVSVSARRSRIPTVGDLSTVYGRIRDLVAYSTNSYELAALGNNRAKSIEAWQYTKAVTRDDLERGMTDWAVTPMWPLGRVEVGQVKGGDDDGKWALFRTNVAHSSENAIFTPTNGVPDSLGDVMSLEWRNVSLAMDESATNDLMRAGISWDGPSGGKVYARFDVHASRVRVSTAEASSRAVKFGDNGSVNISYPRAAELGPYSFISGDAFGAKGPSSHAEGYGTYSDGQYSHAEGAGTLSSGKSSHAEGFDTEASGEFTHAEGSGSKADGRASHAEGYNTFASNAYSHAEGVLSDATNAAAFVWQGSGMQYNGVAPNTATRYGSHGDGTFNVNPVGGLSGFWIGEQTFAGYMSVKADKPAAYTGGNIVVFDGSGNLLDSTLGTNDYVRTAAFSGHVNNGSIHVSDGDRTTWNGKQDSIGDLATIRAGAGLGATAVQPWRKVNGHPLSEDVTVSATDVGLEHVVNTGDSATPVEGGTDKFTTGGAYTELARKADKSEMLVTNVVGDSTKRRIQLSAGVAQDVVVEHQSLSIAEYAGTGEKYGPWADAFSWDAGNGVDDIRYTNGVWRVTYSSGFPVQHHTVEAVPYAGSGADATEIGFYVHGYDTYATASRDRNKPASYTLGGHGDTPIASADFVSDVSTVADNALSRAEAKAGFTAWSASSSSIGVLLIGQPSYRRPNSWDAVLSHNGVSRSVVCTGTPDALELSFFYYAGDIHSVVYVSRARLPTTADLSTVARDATNYTDKSVSSGAFTNRVRNIVDQRVDPVPVYSDGEPTWAFSGDLHSGTDVYSMVWDDGDGEWELHYGGYEIGGEVGDTRVVFAHSGANGGAIIATRTDIVGYTIAGHTDKVFASTNAIKRTAEKTYAMFVIPLNFPGDAVSYCDIELKASTNNFSASADLSARAVYYCHTSLAPEALNTDGIRIYAENISGDMRSYTKINAPSQGLPEDERIPVLVAIVSRDVCMRNQGGEWLYEDNDELVWTYCRSSVGGRENDSVGRALWRPIAPVKWFSRLPKWAE